MSNFIINPDKSDTQLTADNLVNDNLSSRQESHISSKTDSDAFNQPTGISILDVFTNQVEKVLGSPDFFDFLPSGNSTDKLIDLLDTKLLIEPVIVQTAAQHRNDEDINLMLINLKALQNENRIDRFAGLVTEFHCLIAAATQNGVLFLITEQLYKLTAATEIKIFKELPQIKSLIIQGHIKILEAIKARDGKNAYDAMREYIVDIQAYVNAVMIQELSLN